MTTTSREALIVFAENVDNMNIHWKGLKFLETQTEPVSLNETQLTSSAH